MKQTLKTQRGFSLIEVVISIFIVGIILVLYNGALNSVFLTSNAQHQELAMRIAQSEVETLRTAGYSSLPSSGSFSNSLLSSLPTGQGTLTVSAYNSKIKQVVVDVSWKETGSFSVHSVSLTTLITETGGLK